MMEEKQAIVPLSRDEAFFALLRILIDYRKNPEFSVEIAQECLRVIDGLLLAAGKSE
jgi:hypothetical protein